MLALALSAQAGPQIHYLFPAGAPVGGTTGVSAGGEFSSWPVQVWSDDPGVQIVAGAAPGHFHAHIATNAPPGPHLLRFHDDTGASPAWQFVVGEGPEFSEEDPAVVAATVQVPPGVCHGRFEGGPEAVSWRYAVPAGVTLHLEAMAARLDSPGTVRLRLLDGEDCLLGESTNVPPADPELRCLVARAGTYRVEVRPVPADSAPPPSREIPLVYRLQARTTGSRDASVAVARDAFLAGAPRPDLASRLLIHDAPAAPLEPTLHPEMLSPTESLPGTFGGFINPAGDEDRFGFQARRDEIHRFRVRLANPEAPFIPVLRILQDDHVLAESVPGPEGSLTWLAAMDGAYTLVVADAQAAGGPDFAYEIETQAPESRLVATAPSATWRLTPGEPLQLAVAIERPEARRGSLMITASGLPAWVVAEAGVVVPNRNAATLEFRAPPAAPATTQPFQIQVLDSAAFPPRAFPVVAPLLGRYTPSGGLLLNETDTFWLTVGPP